MRGLGNVTANPSAVGMIANSKDSTGLPYNGHTYNGVFSGVNATYADGHVESVNRNKVQWQWYGNWTQFY